MIIELVAVVSQAREMDGQQPADSVDREYESIGQTLTAGIGCTKVTI